MHTALTSFIDSETSIDKETSIYSWNSEGRKRELEAQYNKGVTNMSETLETTEQNLLQKACTLTETLSNIADSLYVLISNLKEENDTLKEELYKYK